EAARDAARDRPGRQLERVADRPVALVAAEEALEDLPARVADRLQAGAHRQRLVQRRQGLVHPRRLEIVELRGAFAPAAAQAVDAAPPRQLADPGPDRLLPAQAVEVLVDAGAHRLGDVLLVVGWALERHRAGRL